VGKIRERGKKNCFFVLLVPPVSPYSALSIPSPSQLIWALVLLIGSVKQSGEGDEN
jgi:hypothetical protein